MAWLSVVEALHENAGAAPDKLAVVSSREQVSYGELWCRISCAAGRLGEKGVRAGDRVVLSAVRTGEFVSGYFACHLLGAVAVPVDPKMPDAVLDDVLRSLGARVVCTSRPRAAGADRRALSYGDLSEGPVGPGADHPAFPAPDDPADVLLTSGTTGSAKAVGLSHRNIAAAARNINEFIGNTADDREAHVLPLSHSFGLGRLRCQMLAGGTLILTGGLVPPTQVVGAMRRWEATGVAFVPAGWSFLWKFCGEELGEFAAQLRYIEIGSAPMPIEEKRRLTELFPKTRICMHYGLTEASRSAFIEFHSSKERLDSIGGPSPNVRIRIVDERGDDVPTGAEGMLVIAGEHVAHDAAGGEWLPSGDLGYRDADDYLYLCDRVDDLINVGGRKVHPGEVEEALRRYPQVADCACVGASDPRGLTGETVKAFLVAAPECGEPPDGRALSDFLADRLEPHKIPTIYEWIGALPRNELGKVSRRQLRAMSSAS